MLIEPLSLEYRNLREQQAYPLAESASGKDTTGTFALPRPLLVGLTLAVDAALGAASERFHLHSLTYLGDSLLVEIGYVATGAEAAGVATGVIASVTVATASHTPYKNYPLVGQGAFADLVGFLSVGRIEGLASGKFLFSLDAGRLEPDTVRQQLPHIGSVSVVSGGQTIGPFTGPFRLEAGARVRLETDLVAGVLTVRLVADVTADEDADCPCDDDARLGDPITSINGLLPGPDGAIGLGGLGCVAVSAAAGALVVEDSCAEPCCDAEDVAALVEELEVLSTAVAAMERLAAELTGNHAALTQNVLASQLPDASCGVTP